MKFWPSCEIFKRWNTVTEESNKWQKRCSERNKGISARKVMIKNTHREKALSNKTLAVRKSTIMGVWAVDTSDQLFIRGS